jgi:hypothetical protein
VKSTNGRKRQDVMTSVWLLVQRLDAGMLGTLVRKPSSAACRMNAAFLPTVSTHTTCRTGTSAPGPPGKPPPLPTSDARTAKQEALLLLGSSRPNPAAAPSDYDHRQAISQVLAGMSARIRGLGPAG